MSFAGLLWRFGLFGKEWMRETGYSFDFLKEHKIEALRAVLFSCLITFGMALAIGLLVGLTRPEGSAGILVLSLILFGGFILLPQVHRVLFEKRSWKSFFVSVGEYAVMIIVGGCAITYFG